MCEPGPLIVIVEDDEEISRLVAALLTKEGFTVETAQSGQALNDIVARTCPDLYILDLMLPEEDGLSICRRLRGQGNGKPILMLTARNDEIDRIVGLEMGADDYLGKPFHPRELLARVRAILRRTNGIADEPESRRYAFEGLTIDLDARVLSGGDGETLPLTSAEFEMLACFVTRPRRVLSRDQLLDWTKGRDADQFDRSIDMTISRLRRKIEAVLPGLNLISTVRNSGYLFRVKPQRLLP